MLSKWIGEITELINIDKSNVVESLLYDNDLLGNMVINNLINIAEELHTGKTKIKRSEIMSIIYLMYEVKTFFIKNNIEDKDRIIPVIEVIIERKYSI